MPNTDKEMREQGDRLLQMWLDYVLGMTLKQFELAYPELPEHANFFDWWASRTRLHLDDHVFVDKDSR